MALGFRRNFSSSLVILAAAACSLSDFAVNSAQAQATIRRRDLVSDWSTTAPNLTSAAPGLTSAAPLATQTPQAAYVPSWNSQPNSWRLGVAIDNAETGVVLTDVERGTPADRAGLKRGDVIVNVGGYQVGYVNGGLFDLGDEIRRRVGQDGKVSFLVFDQTQRRLTNMPIVLVQQSSAGIQGQVVCNERITLTT
jgi:predicted metalloprotease with PDZ domain